ncbi:MAG: winged helix-turn-helix domain-containing protein [Actinocatenispora sp.]
MDDNPHGEGRDREQIRLDARNLRGIAHPVRVRMLTLLRTDGPATATTLAQRLGLNTGATSYHLRQLAEHGFIEDDPDRGSRRERWWKAAHRNTVLTDDLLGDDSGLGEAFLRSVAQVQADGMLRAVDELPTLPDAWRAAQEFSDYRLTLTPAQASALAREIHAVLGRHNTGDAVAEDSAPVTFQFQLFPNLGDAAPRADARSRDDETTTEER